MEIMMKSSLCKIIFEINYFWNFWYVRTYTKPNQIETDNALLIHKYANDPFILGQTLPLSLIQSGKGY